MQEKKNKRLFISLIVLLGATISAYWFGREENTFKVDKKLFQVADLKTVDQVTLESPSGKIELKLDGSRWKVNGQYEADRNMIDVLFATLQQAEPKRPLASSLQDSIRTTIGREGVKVTLRSGGEVADSFMAGGNSQKTQGYFYREDGSVYLMVIPGYRVYVSGIFELGVNGWRDKYVFGLNWRNQKSVDVNFGQKKSDDFKVLMDESNLTIEGMAQTDTTKLYDFLDAVSLLTVEEYVETTPSLDSLKATKPALSFLFKDISGKEYSLAIYPSARRQFSGLINGQEWALLQAGQVQAVFRPRPYFIKK